MCPKRINNLKDFVSLYGQKKSDVELSQLLNITVEQIQLPTKNKNNKNK